MSKRWYVVHAYSGFEHQVARSLKERIERFGMQDRFGRVLVPTEEVIEMRAGQKRKTERKFYPGYVLVEIETHQEGRSLRIDDECWHLVRETPRVLGFIGGTADRPLPISTARLRLSCARCKRVQRNRSRRCSSSRANWCGSPTAPSTISTAPSRRSITRRIGYVWPCRFLVARRRSSLSFLRWRRPEQKRGALRAS